MKFLGKLAVEVSDGFKSLHWCPEKILVPNVISFKNISYTSSKKLVLFYL